MRNFTLAKIPEAIYTVYARRCPAGRNRKLSQSRTESHDRSARENTGRKYPLFVPLAAENPRRDSRVYVTLARVYTVYTHTPTLIRTYACVCMYTSPLQIHTCTLIGSDRPYGISLALGSRGPVVPRTRGDCKSRALGAPSGRQVTAASTSTSANPFYLSFHFHLSRAPLAHSTRPLRDSLTHSPPPACLLHRLRVTYSYIRDEEKRIVLLKKR